ncbi:uncharacterized protein GLRG_09258 [Colletotrichum graminicola M1.001]|uniref:Uncharacterized protein n=1 Tax=Colletotrichum graminicola (strain M1.001 / M2 / FGSC 10212) TaxID=645133 RepID=E3QTC6_COLGM|nr:uncharacterized protein GLRG_09258 [Colletotrichum graminicola M1.001]EFQ34114.1 hypothetical protein GLRG_09258 [Colletotrichum graminicola M1.001]
MSGIRLMSQTASGSIIMFGTGKEQPAYGTSLRPCGEEILEEDHGWRVSNKRCRVSDAQWAPPPESLDRHRLWI